MDGRAFTTKNLSIGLVVTDGIKAKIAALIQEDLGMTALIVIIPRLNGTKRVNPALPESYVYLIQNLPPSKISSKGIKCFF